MATKSNSHHPVRYYIYDKRCNLKEFLIGKSTKDYHPNLDNQLTQKSYFLNTNGLYAVGTSNFLIKINCFLIGFLTITSFT